MCVRCGNGKAAQRADFRGAPAWQPEPPAAPDRQIRGYDTGIGKGSVPKE
jgi:hypothetical protein